MKDIIDPLSLVVRTKEILASPETINTICAHVSNGGSIHDLVRMWDVRYCDVHAWINDDPVRKKQYLAAMQAQNDWVVDRLLLELRSISFVDARKIFKPDGTLVDVEDWPDDVARAISGIDIEEAKTDSDGNEVKGRTRKVKLVDKLRAIELIGKNMKMFTERVSMDVRVTIEDLVMGSMGVETVDAVAVGPDEAVTAKGEKI